MNQRNALAIAVLILFPIIILICLQPAPQQQKTSGIANFSSKLTVAQSGMTGSDFGNEAFENLQVDVGGFSQASIELSLLSHPPEREIYLLDYPVVDSSDYALFKSGLKSRLSDFGARLKPIGPNGTYGISNSLLIVPTGAYPTALSPSEARLVENGNTILFIGQSIDLGLSPDGSIISEANFSEKLPVMQLENSSIQVLEPKEMQNASLDSGRIVWVKGTLNSLGPPDQAADFIFGLVVQKPWLARISKKTFDISNSKSSYFFFLEPSKESSGYLYSVVRLADHGGHEKGALFFSNVSALRSGRLSNAQSAFPGQQVNFSFTIAQENPSPISLNLGISIFGPDSQHSETQAGQAKMRDVWFGIAHANAPSVPGDYLCVLHDQYGRQLAISHLHVYNLSAQVDGAYEDYVSMQILLDGADVDSQATVWKSSQSQNVTLPVLGGEIKLPTKLSAGENTFNVLVFGQRLQASAQYSGQLPFGTYAFIGAFSLAAIIWAFVAFRGRLKDKITVFTPPPLPNAPIKRQKEVRMADLKKAFMYSRQRLGISVKFPLLAKEICMGLCATLQPGAELCVTKTNVESVLFFFEGHGDVKSELGYYGATARGSRDSGKVGKMALLRIASDSLLSHGIAPKLAGNKLVALHRGKKTVFCPSRSLSEIISLAAVHGNVAVIFHNENNAREFVNGIAGSGALQEKKLARLIGIGKVYACSAENAWEKA